MQAKYVRLWTQERTALASFNRKYKKLYSQKEEFYSKGHTDETRAKGWVYPVSGVILKTKVPEYIKADPDILDLEEKIQETTIKVDALQTMVQTFSYRSNLISLILKIRMWEGGG